CSSLPQPPHGDGKPHFTVEDRTMRMFAAVTRSGILTAPAFSQQPPAKPGPELDRLKKLEGTWDTTMKVGGMENKGTTVYKMELGGLWLAGSLNADLGGQKFSGKSLDSFDP